MKGTPTLHLLFISGFVSFALGSADFHLINDFKTYTEAKSYCRDMYTDLATIHNSTDMDNLITSVSGFTVTRAWIGLEAGDVWMWHWSWPDQQLDFLNWKAGEPQIRDEDACAAMDQHGNWTESDCRSKKKFVCHGNSDTSGLIFVADTKSWRDAQTHCRGLSSDLISIQSAEENEEVHNVSKSQNVWIGLFKDPWKWSDGSMSSFRYWKPNQPNYNEGQACAASVLRDDGKWNDIQCSGRRKFVCRGARKPTAGPTNQTSNLTTIPNTSQIVTIHFTLASNQSNATNVTTIKATTATQLTSPNTTDPVATTSSSTELSNATTERPTVTVTQQPATTANITTGGVSTLTTLMRTSAQTTAQSSTLKPSHTLHSGNLILIQENLTWIEAMSYCREHHVDLVHITNTDIQGKVAELAKNATSAHVWLGLRYACKLNFWFWTTSTLDCYQNWADGQGPERKYECGVTGAIEATGGQQWVGLSETEQLNFMCSACTG